MLRVSIHAVFTMRETVGFSLGELLTDNKSDFKCLEASLPVDHVCALMAVSSDAERVAQVAPPNNLESTEQTYIQIANYLIQEEGSYMLGHCGND